MSSIKALRFYEQYDRPLLSVSRLLPPEGELITLADTNDLAYAKQMTRYLKIVVVGELFIWKRRQVFVCMNITGRFCQSIRMMKKYEHVRVHGWGGGWGEV